MQKLTAEEVREIRTSLGLTQQELAATLRVAVSTVARWETGVQTPNPAMTYALTELRKKH